VKAVSTTQRLLATLLEIPYLIAARTTLRLRATLVACHSRLAQYDLVFRTANGSEGHANVYLVKAGNDQTLVVTGQIMDPSDGPRVLENDHVLAFALGRFWLLRRARIGAAFGEVYHFTADMDSDQIVETWREGEAPGWQPFPSKLKSISQIEQTFDVVFPSYRGARSAIHDGNPIKADDAISLATFIGAPAPYASCHEHKIELIKSLLCGLILSMAVELIFLVKRVCKALALGSDLKQVDCADNGIFHAVRGGRFPQLESSVPRQIIRKLRKRTVVTK
jgi:hypothetical protein